ncbi:uncharacterized protein LOC141676518 [Apium graveolens]|uniref:uncharacterized protein LOC141676518 n=1 Tax=Apium graveolens TaxID=4045 RepID=UPI003D7A5910
MVRGPRRAKKVNGYDLGVLYVPSHRHKDLPLKPEMAQQQKFTMIHNYKPAIVKTIVKERGGVNMSMDKSDCMTTPQKRCPHPVLPQALRERMQEHWASVLVRNPFSHFMGTQYQKHGQHHKYRDDVEYHEQGYKHGSKYMTGGKYDLMRIMRKRGYKPGYKYSCRGFVKALEEELGHPILVTFKYAGKMKYLDEISTLYYKRGRKIVFLSVVQL